MIDIVKVKDRDGGNLKACDILKEIVDAQTLLALSGGGSPDYKKILIETGNIIPGAICVVDDRFGEPFHRDSTELLLREAGIKRFADDNCIESRKILTGKDLIETGRDYAKVIADLFSRFPKRIGLMGVGANLHTAGIFPFSLAAKSPELAVGETVDDEFSKRVTITLRALGEFTNVIILMFGSAKQNALKILLDEDQNNMQKYPAIFYRKAAVKSFLITDIEL